MATEDDRIQDFINKIVAEMAGLKRLGLKQFSKRIEGLENNIELFARQTIRSGLVGITSSGKSSLMNTLLGTGTRILKEQSKATTNMIAFCSKSPDEPRLEIFFENREPIKKTGPEVLAEPIWKYTSEDENPQNKFNVKFIKLALPTFMLDEDIELADTPGLDAFGHKEHEDLTLREFLPQANLIIYLSSIRSPMKEADRRIIDKIMDADQRIIFVQTCKGAVVEQRFDEAGTKTVEEQLADFKTKLKEAVSHYDNLKDAPIVQVETAQAMEYFKTRDMAAWRQSGLDEFMYVIGETTKQIKAEFTLINLRRIIDEALCINQFIKNMLKEEEDKSSALEQQTTFLSELTNCCEHIIEDHAKVVEEWSGQLDHVATYNKYHAEFAEIYTARYNFNPMHDKKFLDKSKIIEEDTKRLKSEFLDNIDVAKKRYGRFFKELGLDVRRMDYQQINEHTFFLPNVQKKRIADALGPTKDKEAEVTGEYVDKNRYIKDLEGSLRLFFEPLGKHLEWWSQVIAFSFIEPLQKKIAAIRDDMANVEKGHDFDDIQKEVFADISGSLETAVQAILPVFDTGAVGRKIKGYSRYIGTIEQIKFESTNIFLQLGNRLFENLFHTYYLECLQQLSGQEKKTVLLLGQNLESQIGFLRRVMRLNNEMMDLLRTTEPPFAINYGKRLVHMKNIPLRGEMQGQVSFFVLANDEKSFAAAEANNLFKTADVVQMSMDDLHRVGSAMRDMVERLLFFDLVREHRNKLLLTYSAAAYFQKEKLHMLVTEAIAEVGKVFQPVQVPWFIHENFEVRYGYFSQLARKMQREKSTTEIMLNEWKTLGLPLDEPFSETVLKEQFKMVASDEI